MFERISRIVVYEYDDKPAQTLYRHHRVQFACARTCLRCCVLSLSLTAEFLISYEWYERTLPPRVLDVFPFIIVGVAALAIVLFAPMVLALYLTRDICVVLAERGLTLPVKRFNEKDLGITAMKMCFWCGVILLFVHLTR